MSTVNEETRQDEQVQQVDQPVSDVAAPETEAAAELPQGVEDAANQDTQQSTQAEAAANDGVLDQFKSENDSLRSKLLESKAKFAALSLGISEARIDYAIRLAGLDGIDVNSGDADKRIQEALRDVLGQIPEWKAEPKLPPAGTGSAGGFSRNTYHAPSSPAGAAKDQFVKGMGR